MSESENSETEERGKYNKAQHKHSSSEEASSDNVKPILARDKRQQRTANIEITKLNAGDKHPLQHHKSSVDEKLPTKEEVQAEEDAPTEDANDIVQLEFKNDLIFDLDM